MLRFSRLTFLTRDGNFALLAVVGLALFKLLAHVLSNANYGYFRDEFYYLAASERLAFGYVDFPPAIALLTAFARLVFGESLVALRLLPALAGAGVVLLAGLMAYQLGAGRFGQALAALAVVVAPQYLGMNSLLTMDSFEMLVWATALYLLVLIVRHDKRQYWLLFGLVAGIGLTIKVSMLYFGFALAVGLALTPERRHFRNPYLYLGGGLALVFFLPYLAWNAAHGWPTVEFWGNYGNKVFQASAPVFLLQQVLIMHPLSLPLWLGGLVFLFTPGGRQYRLFGWMYLVLLVVFMLQGAKNYFLAPYYPILFAFGAVAMRHLSGLRFLERVRVHYALLLLASGVLLAPMSIPMLPLDAHIAYLRVMGGATPKSENIEAGIFPQHFADRFGWQELAATVSDVYRSLPSEDRDKVCIFASNYGQAGALQFFSAQYDLPPVISTHNNFYLWGPGDCTGEVIIYVGRESVEALEQVFSNIEPAAVTACQYCMPYEDDQPVLVLRDMRFPIEQAWPQFKVFQ